MHASETSWNAARPLSCDFVMCNFEMDCSAIFDKTETRSKTTTYSNNGSQSTPKHWCNLSCKEERTQRKLTREPERQT